eukprot:TRINITY_DN103837_c0_g1_i1.p1 TRINITY_DN103837_c0_g1~~TRINITY_DN103837_c0_g1_i1.p1  ORF type:complete len:184 (-),score=9.95 TRINITY_DN103837_c0_g1_i1:232-783(-)
MACQSSARKCVPFVLAIHQMGFPEGSTTKAMPEATGYSVLHNTDMIVSGDDFMVSRIEECRLVCQSNCAAVSYRPYDTGYWCRPSRDASIGNLCSAATNCTLRNYTGVTTELNESYSPEPTSMISAEVLTIVVVVVAFGASACLFCAGIVFSRRTREAVDRSSSIHARAGGLAKVNGLGHTAL